MGSGPKRLPLGTFQGLADAHFHPSTLSVEDGRSVQWCKTASSWEVLDPILWSNKSSSRNRTAANANAVTHTQDHTNTKESEEKHLGVGLLQGLVSSIM
jgi:hypothetical protein